MAINFKERETWERFEEGKLEREKGGGSGIKISKKDTEMVLLILREFHTMNF